MQNHFTPASAAAFLVFVLLYAPCIVTMTALKTEFGARWMVFSFVYLLGLAWLAGFVTYQVGLVVDGDGRLKAQRHLPGRPASAGER